MCVLGPTVSYSVVPKPCFRAAHLPFVVAVPGVSLGLATRTAIVLDCCVFRRVNHCSGENLALVLGCTCELSTTDDMSGWLVV